MLIVGPVATPVVLAATLIALSAVPGDPVM